MARRIKFFGGQHQTLPIKNPKQITELCYHMLNKIEAAKTEVKKYQAARNYMIILIGLNTAFRAEDLLQLRVTDVINGYVSVKENKTGKMQNYKMNKQLHQEIQDYVKKYDLKQYDYLFKGQMKTWKGTKYIYPVNRQQGYKIVSKAGKEIGIDFCFGLHSLRKTFGYQYISNGGNILTLMKMYNHDSPDVTQLYVCWGKEDAEKDRIGLYLGVKKQKK